MRGSIQSCGSEELVEFILESTEEAYFCHKSAVYDTSCIEKTVRWPFWVGSSEFITNGVVFEGEECVHELETNPPVGAEACYGDSGAIPGKEGSATFVFIESEFAIDGFAAKFLGHVLAGTINLRSIPPMCVLIFISG